MISIRKEKPSDVAAREALLDAAYGRVRFEKPSEQLRRGRSPAAGLAFVAVEAGQVVGTVRLWDVSAGPACPALLLGPLAVRPDCRNRGIGAALMRRALAAARRRSHGAVLLVGDAAYYRRFGFSVEKTQSLWLPGHCERHRLLGVELTPGALARARGAIQVPRRTATPLVARIAAAAARDTLVPSAA
jgi:predicted N-acetyltransferase YhbS